MDAGFRNACLMVVLSVGYRDRLFGAEMCGEKASQTSKEECEVSLDKRTPNFLKDTWPGIGALVLGMEDEFPEVRTASVVSIGQIAKAHPVIKDLCVRVALEGLQDRELGVRLACLKVALESKPKPLRSGELRLLLETIANDKSEQVKCLALEFFLHGPEFSDNALALASVEWLANLTPKVCSLRYMFCLGKRHANILYFCAGEMEASCCNTKPGGAEGVLHQHHQHHNKQALLAAMAGVASVWGLPLQLSDKSLIKQECADWLRRLQSGSTVVEEEDKSLFWQQLAAAKCSGKETKQALLKQWSGFDLATVKRLKQWAEEGEGDTEVSFVRNELEDEQAPHQTKFEFAVNRSRKPSATALVQISRYQVSVRAHHYSGNGTPTLTCNAESRQTFPLTVKETRGSLTVFDPVWIPIALVGGDGAREPRFGVENV
ncbi:hypothetical protein BASA81_002264 [Batrachochytrium salamandrivorans]|nr:hypothetical protein BASA81_002264 [Batrachochytrium salamandrivorans]